MIILQGLFLLVLGHFTAAFLVYLNHRFVFHGKLGKIGPLKHIRKYHSLHHAHAWGNKMYYYILVPWWARILFLGIYAAISLVSVAFAVGLATFSAYYAYNHYAIHKKSHRGHSFYHHSLHHSDAKVNFSGMYPFIDRLFSTYKESRPIL